MYISYKGIFEGVHLYMYNIELHYMTINKQTLILFVFIFVINVLTLQRDLKTMIDSASAIVY